MPPQPSKSHCPVVTSAVLVETSVGAFVVDLFGVDSPAATAEFVNMCRCKYFNGCIASEVVPDNIIIFSHPIEALRGQTFASLVERTGPQKRCGDRGGGGNVDQLMCREWERMKGHVASLRQRNGSTTTVEFLPKSETEAPGSITRRGLLLLEVPRRPDTTESSGAGAPVRSLVLTLSNRHLDYFEDRFMVVGEVREGIGVIEKFRSAPHRRLPAPCTVAARPTRLIRIKHTTVLPTAGTEVFLDVWRDHTGKETSPQSKALMSALTAAGCFCHWATPAMVRVANSALVSIMREAASASSSGEKTECGDTDFFLLGDKHAEGTLRETEDKDDVLSVEYNPHYHGDYLSSNDDNDDDGASHAASRKERESRHQAVMRMHQDKLNETRALMLNLLDGIADVSGELKPPENVLFVCKLNPLTTSEGLMMCFSQCGRVLSAEVVRDRRTDNSLCYGFVEFEDVEACYRAFRKMDKALVDDHRIHVDFSQSVSKLWAQRQRDGRKRARG